MRSWPSFKLENQGWIIMNENQNTQCAKIIQKPKKKN